MTTRRLILSACVLCALSTATVATSHANDIPGPPSAPCTLGERMNIHIEDGWMYECACSVLAHGFHCQWDLVGQVGTAVISREPKKHRIKKHHHRVVLRYALPGVVG